MIRRNPNEDQHSEDFKTYAQLHAQLTALKAERTELREALKQMLAEFETLTDSDPDYAPIAAKAKAVLAKERP